MTVFSNVRRQDPNRIGGLSLDVNWINECFMLPKTKALKNNPVNKGSYSWMYFSSAEVKFVNTSLGGNFSINQPPAYTIFTDPPVGLLANRISKESVSLGITEGMGQYYSEAIDDNAHRVQFRFGHPQYKGLITFFTGFYNARMAMLGNQGRTWTDAFYFLGFVVGGVFGLPLQVIGAIGWAARLALGRPSTQYYTLTSSMPLYWRRVDMIANRLASMLYLTPAAESFNEKGENTLEKMGLEDTAEGMTDAQKKKARRANFDEYNRYMDGMFNESGGIDVYTVVNKTNRMAAEAALARRKAESATSLEGFVNAMVSNANAFKKSSYAQKGDSLMEYLKEYHNTPLGAVTLVGKDGKEYDVYRRDPITDRINDARKLDPNAQGGGGGVAPTAENGETVQVQTAEQPTAAQPTTQQIAEGGSAQVNPTTTNIVGNSFTTTNTLATTKQAQSLVAPLAIPPTIASPTSTTQTGTQQTTQSSTNTNVSTTTPSTSTSTGTTTNGAEGTSINASAPAASTEVPLGDGMLGEPPTGDDAKEMMKQVAQQDSYINSILEVESYDEEKDEGVLKRTLGWLSEDSNVGIRAVDYFKDATRRGSDFVGFKVESVSSVSESWSNSSVEGEITGAINGLSSAARAVRYSLSDFKTGFGAIDATLTAVRSTVAGLVDGFQVSGILALAGSGMVDIPKRYAESSTQLTTSSYTLELRSAYGDPMSVFLNIYMPFICLLAGAVPISHGMQSYGSPFYCELYDRGRQTIRLGMIESLSVTRGAGTTAWSGDGLPLGIDVSFTVANMNTIMHAPIDPGLLGILPWHGMPNTDNAWADYLGSLANLSLEEMSNPYKRIGFAGRAWWIGVDQMFNPARLGNWAADFGIVRFASSVMGAVAPDYKTTAMM